MFLHGRTPKCPKRWICSYPALKRGMKQSVSGMQAETVKDPRMQKIRRPDRLADELAKGRPVEKVLR